MKHLCLIAGSILTIGFMTSCNQAKTTTSHSVASDAEQAALEAEQAELELAKLAEIQKQNDTTATVGQKGKSGGRQPASTAPAKVVKHEAKHAESATKKVDKKADKKKVVEHKAVEKKAEAKKVDHKVEAKPADVKHEVKHEAPAAPKHEAHAPAAKVETQSNPQAVAKKEMEGDISVFAKKEAVPAAHHIGAVAALDKHHVPSAAPAPASVKSQTVSRSSVWIVQVGAFRVKDNASKLEEKLKGSGFPVRMKEVNHSKNGMLYVVQFEPTPNRDEANSWRDQVKAKAAIDAQLVARPD